VSLRAFARHRAMGEMKDEIRDHLRRKQRELLVQDLPGRISPCAVHGSNTTRRNEDEPVAMETLAVDMAPSPEQHAAKQEFLDACAQGLSRKAQWLLRLRYREGLDFRTIASRMRMSLAAVWFLHSKTLTVLRERFSEKQRHSFD
jgi:RNA polymerase sigma factor (sigma-70 family)